MKKLLFGMVLTIMPPLFFILTTPFPSLAYHFAHILFSFVLGLGMAGIYFENQFRKDPSSHFFKLKISTPFNVVMLTFLVIFAISHSMPCPYMFSSHTAQTMIDHPCSQPAPSCTPTFSFAISQIPLTPGIFPIPTVAFSEIVQSTDNRAPPSA